MDNDVIENTEIISGTIDQDRNINEEEADIAEKHDDGTNSHEDQVFNEDDIQDLAS